MDGHVTIVCYHLADIVYTTVAQSKIPLGRLKRSSSSTDQETQLSPTEKWKRGWMERRRRKHGWR